MNQEEKKTKLFRRDFTMVVTGQIISLFGNAILRFALPLYLLQVTESASLFGIVTACSFLPVIVLSLLGGVLADRVHKRNIMVLLDFSTAALMLLFCLLLGKIPPVGLLLAVMMLLYGIQGIYQPAVQASIPAIVTADKLLQGNAIINQVSSLANLLGPVLGGVLYGLFGIRLIAVISVVCFLISAVMELFIHIPHTKRELQGGVMEVVRSDLYESFDFMKTQRPEFLKVAMIIALFNLFLSAVLIVGLPVLLVGKLGISDNLFGLSQGFMAFGGLAGGAITGMLGGRLRINRAHTILFACSLSVLPMGLCILADLPVMVSYIIITLSSFMGMASSTMFVIQLFAYVQQKTPQELVGKVISVLMVIGMCAQPAGQAMYGILLERFAANPGGILVGAALAGCVMAAFSAGVFGKIVNDACIPARDSVQ